MADEFLMGGVRPMADFPKTNESPNESKPASVPAGNKEGVGKPFTNANSNGPWITDAAKKGTGGKMEWNKISRMADNHSEFFESHK